MKQCAPQQPCKPIESKCVLYSGQYLSTLDVFAGTNLDIILKKINDKFSVSLSTIFSVSTPSVTLGGLGTLVNPLAANVNISVTVGNLLTVNSDGLYVSVPIPDLQSVTNVGNTTTNTLIVTGDDQEDKLVTSNIQMIFDAGTLPLKTGIIRVQDLDNIGGLGLLQLHADSVYVASSITGITEAPSEDSDKLASTAWVNDAIASIPIPPTPDLQLVTDTGNETTNVIVVKGSNNFVGHGDGLYLTHVPSNGSSIVSLDADTPFQYGSLVFSTSGVNLSCQANAGIGRLLSIISSGTGGAMDISAELISISFGDLTFASSGNSPQFNTTVIGQPAVNSNEFVVLSQLSSFGTVSSVSVTSSDITVTGSPITTSGIITLTLPNIVTANTFNNITFNSKGQVTGGSNVAYLTTETDPVANAKTVTINVGTGLSRTVGTATQTVGANPSFTLINTAPDQTVALSNGTGISATGTYPNFTITNTLPDQTVVLSNGTGISVTGTYPNFTIANTAPFTGSFINNSTSPQAGASFNIGGSGVIGTNFTVTNGITNITGDITFSTTPSGGITFNFDGGNSTGDIFYRSSSGKLARLPIGTGVLGVSGGIPAWVPAGGTGTVTSIGLTSSDITVGGTSPITTSGTFTLTLPNINANVGTFNNVTVNAKGQVTAASNVAYITASSADLLTNKTGNISQWTNDAGYLTSVSTPNLQAVTTVGNTTNLTLISTNTEGLKIQNDTSTVGFYASGGGSHGYLRFSLSEMRLFSDTGIPLIFGTSGGEKMRLTNTGSLGIGTNNPQASLDVRGTGMMATSYGSLTGTDVIIEVPTGRVANVINGDLVIDQQIKISGGTPGLGKILTDSDGNGLATWQDAGLVGPFLLQTTATQVGSGSYTVIATDVLVRMNASSGFTLNIPTAAGNTNRVLILRNLSSSNTVTLNISFTGLTGSISSLPIQSSYMIISDGTVWQQI